MVKTRRAQTINLENNLDAICTETIIEIPFHDADPMNVVWHGNYVKYIEIARCELLELFGYNYDAMHDSNYAWPIVDMRLKYIKPAQFKQKIVVESRLVEWESRIKINYIIRDQASGERLTKGYTIQMAVDINTGETVFESPAILRQLLESFLEKAEKK